MEVAIRAIPYRPFQPKPKASEWRCLEYSEPVPEIQKPASRLYAAIKKAALIDQSTGATFAALADRGLLQVDWRDPDVWGKAKPYLRLTPAGRKLARFWTGQKAYKAPPPGTLRSGTGGHWWWPTSPVTTAWRVSTANTGQSAGRRLYAREWAGYQALYPDVDAPSP